MPSRRELDRLIFRIKNNTQWEREARECWQECSEALLEFFIMKIIECHSDDWEIRKRITPMHVKNAFASLYLENFRGNDNEDN
jgi:hypothetical protein